MLSSRKKHIGESGQAAVESAITLPLAVFMVLGTLQLFLMLQGRIMAQYAVFKAVRAGSVNHGDCRVMTDAALAALLPTFSRTDSPAKLVEGFKKRNFTKQYKYTGAGEDTDHDKQIFWLDRIAISGVAGEQKDFDQHDSSGGDPAKLEAQLVFWYPLKIPFVNWVVSRMFLAYFGIQSYDAQNPLMMTARAHEGWKDAKSPGPQGDIRAELQARAQAKQYEFPIVVSYSMRMMTPAREPFAAQCPRFQ
jgi:hypothetical protein